MLTYSSEDVFLSLCRDIIELIDDARELNDEANFKLARKRGAIQFPDFPTGLPSVDSGELTKLKENVAGLEAAITGLQTKTDGILTTVNQMTTDEGLQNNVRGLQNDVAVLKLKDQSTLDEINQVKSDLLGTSKSISDLQADVNKLERTTAKNTFTHKDYFHQLLTLDRDVDLSGAQSGEVNKASVFLPFNSYQEPKQKFQSYGRFSGHEGRNTIILLFHLISIPILFEQAKLAIQKYLNVRFQIAEIDKNGSLRFHNKSQVLLNDYVNSESLTVVPFHFLLDEECDLVVNFGFQLEPTLPFPPTGALKISKERTALLHFIPLFSNRSGKVTLKEFPDVDDIISNAPFERFADLAVRMIHHTEPTPPFYVHHRLFVRNMTLRITDFGGVSKPPMQSKAARGGTQYYHTGSNTATRNVGESVTTQETIYNISLRTTGSVNNNLETRYQIIGFVMPEYVYFGLQGNPLWLDINVFNLHRGNFEMCVEVIGFYHRDHFTYGTIGDSVPDIGTITAKPPDQDSRSTTYPGVYPQLEFYDTKNNKLNCNILTGYTLRFPSVHDSIHFSGGGPILTPSGLVNWETICNQYPETPRYNLGNPPVNRAYESIGIFLCPKDFTGTPYYIAIADNIIFGFGNNGTDGIIGEGVFRSALNPNGYPPDSEDVWFPGQ